MENIVIAFLAFLNFCLCATAQVSENEAKFTFDKRFVGVAFSPYVKMWEDGAVPYFNSYTVDDIKHMLLIISSRFTNVSTYGMGVASYNIWSPWNETDSNCLVGKAAAELNRENGRLVISMSQGIYQNSDVAVMDREIDNAFRSTVNANSIYKGTVWGITYTNQMITPPVAEELIQRIRDGKLRAQNIGGGIKIGARIYNCADMLPPRNENNKILEDFARELDYIMCHGYPVFADALEGVEGAVESIARKYKELIAGFKEVSPTLDVILGETGWPSLGSTHFGPPSVSTIQNLYTFWTELGKWASSNHHQIQLFEAFDEPWKSDYNIPDPNIVNGRFGGEGHFGWWKRTDNKNAKAYVEKILEPQETFEKNSSDVLGNGIDKVNSKLNIWFILIPFFVIGIVTVIVGYLVYRLKLANKTIARLTEADIREFIEGSNVPRSEDDETHTEENVNNLPYNRDFELPKEKIYIEREVILGQGEFGMVFKGTIEIEGEFEEVAFKTTKSSTSIQHLKSLLSELKLMIYIGTHPNVIRLVGAYTEELRNGILYIAAEFCSKGSLENLLRKKSVFVGDLNEAEEKEDDKVHSYANVTEFHAEKEEVTRSQMDSWALQIACGMTYLASRKVIHSDLATRNVLVANDNLIRITDFGLSRRLYEYTSYVKASQEPLPWRWMAFESLRNLSFSSQSDVWSYAVTVWEIYSMGDIPYPGLSWDITFVQQLDKGLRMPAPKYARPETYNKMLECWDLDPLSRPTFTELENFFTAIMASSS